MQKTFNLTRTKELVKNYLSTEKTPQFVLSLVSTPGQGKTSIVKDITRELGLRLVTIPAASIVRQTFQLSFVKSEKLQTMTLDELSDPLTVIFIEEIDRTPVSTLPILLPLLAGRIVGNIEVKAKILTTVNFPDKLQSLDSALPSRLILLPIRTETSEVFRYLVQRHLQNDQKQKTTIQQNQQNSSDDNDLIMKLISAFRQVCETTQIDDDLFNPRSIDNFIEAVRVLRLANTDEIETLAFANFPTHIAENLISHLIWDEMPSVSSPQILDYIFTDKPTGKHYYALRLLILHISQCSNNKNCSHPQISEIVNRLFNAPSSIVDTFGTAIVELPEDTRAKLVDQIMKVPKNQREMEKLCRLLNFISKTMTLN